MALIDAPIDEDNPVYVGFRANNAAEMELLLTQWFADNPDMLVMDIEVNATGAAPNFLCTLLVGEDAGTTPSVSGDNAVAVVIGGVSQVDALAMAAELGVAIRALSPGVDTLFKAVAAGGGAGPHWMAVALAGSAPVV